MPEENERLRPLRPGTVVEVKNKYTGSWSRGFKVVKAITKGETVFYRLSRLSDQTVLPEEFPQELVRLEKKRTGNWWF
jgi:hypothetical protein